MTVTLRFAPSPTGRLHIGNARTALLNWLYARKMGGSFILRLDDTDVERSTAAHAKAIAEDLTWLGLGWDRLERQSDRFERYGDIVARLKADGRLYPCYESADELDRKRKRQRARGLPPIYDRAALKLTGPERARLEADGKRPHWRFLLDNCDDGRPGVIAPTLVHWNDLVRGEQSVDVGSLSDPILIRADGSYLYTLCSVIDDIDFGVTHIVRGEDHVTNTGVQIQLFRALVPAALVPPAPGTLTPGTPVPGGQVPTAQVPTAQVPFFAHHSLLIGPDGSGLSKRLGSMAIGALRADGLEPMAVASHAALIGTSDAVQPYQSLDELAALFDFDKLSRAPGKFDIKELKLLNGKLLRAAPFETVADRLSAAGIAGGQAFWEAVRPNLSVFGDAMAWWTVVAKDITPVIEDAAFCSQAASALPAEPWDESTWGAWTTALKASSGHKGRALFHPLRLALTGRDNGPELKMLLPLIGRTRALARLGGDTG